MNTSSNTRGFVRRRAKGACEYCGLPEYVSVLPHQIDHIIGRQHGGAPPSGRPVTLTGMELYRLSARTIAELWGEYNMAELFVGPQTGQGGG